MAAKGLVNVGPDMTAELGVFEGVLSSRIPLGVPLGGYQEVEEVDEIIGFGWWKRRQVWLSKSVVLRRSF